IMIDDLDKTIEELLKRELPASLVQQVSITFATPDSKFPPTSVTLPAVNLFLYDIRENLELRDVEWTIDSNNGTPVRKRPLVRLDCSYLVTAWPNPASNPAAPDGHRLLPEVMRGLMRHRTIPYT